MPFTDAVSSVASGRNSRASNVSGATGASRSVRSPPPSMPPNDTLANAGVLSMLKTSTDTGDIGALSFNSSRLPSMPRATRQRRGHASRPSQHHTSGVSSNHSYAPSQTSRISSQWDNASTQRRGSLTSMQSMPPSLPPVHVGKPSLAMMPPTPDNPRDSRSYSMTSAPPAQQLPRHRSATSLKSQGHEPRQGNRMPPGPVPPMPENRPPFVYPTRLKRPGYRSPSPALSDTYAHGPPPGLPHMPRRAPGQGPLPPPQAYAGYHPDFPGGYPQDPSLLNVRPQPRAVNNSPGPAYAPNPYQYRQGSMRNMPPPGMPHGMPQPMMGMPQQPMQPSPGHYQSRVPYPPGPQYGPPRPGYAPYPHVPHVPHGGHRGPPMPNVAPMAHQMFHNAARMARTVPHRTDTPMTDTGPPSSDPPSSGSAPDSSSPPTPKDHTTIQVVVDPAFINPDLVDLPDSSSEPVLPAKYFDYADGLEKPIHEPDMEVAHPSVPPSGFVQRVKAMLESKAAAEAAAMNELEKGSRQDNIYELDVDHDPEDISELADLHELAANETPRFTIIEEFEAPVELPASLVKVAELEAVEASQRQSTQRLTRDLVKAELGPSSADTTMQHYLPDDTTTNLIVTMQQKHEREMPLAIDYGNEQRQDGKIPSPSSHEQAEVQRQNSVSDTATTASDEGSIPSGVGYAMRFSGPVDTTVASDETQSKDPFALDADTITIQQQQAREASRSETRHDVKVPTTPEPPRNHEHDNVMERTPISPLRSDEETNHRTSAVSPLHTETLGIDETLRLAADDRTEITGIDEQSEPESSQPEDTMPPPTPRTPKTYSKSVQIQPSVTITDSNSTGTNRFSLPGDLSTVGDTTLNSASEMVTDVAVRFSLPQTTVTVGRPQIVDVSNSSTPDKPKIELTAFQKQHADLRAVRRSSVTFADEIAPLNITKKAEPHRPLPPSSEASANKGKSIIRKPSPRDDTMETIRGPRDNITDLRFSGTNNTNAGGPRFGSTHLPGLKEESVEDMIISDHKRSSHHDQFPLPARIAAVKAMQERRLQESADKAKARRQARQHNRPLADTRDLPSLNFSRIDLIDRLNEALEIRPAKSMDLVRRRDYPGIYCPSPKRPQSTEPLRERYTSFFSKPDEFSSFMLEEAGHSDEELEPEPETEKALVPALQIQETTEVEGVEPAKRPLSPEDFLDFASQVQRLSVPTVTPLTDRLSELIPGLRNLSNLQLDSLFASAHDGLDGQNGELGRPDTVMTNRTSAGFRTLAERAEEIVKNGTHDSMAQLARSLGLNKELPPLPESASAGKVSSSVSSPDGKHSYLSGSASAPSDLGKDLTRPMSALLRAKVPTTEEEVAKMLPKEMNPITRNAKRSVVLSQPSSRPWNLDENYPWAENKVDIDLMVPSKAHTRNSFASEVLRERRTKSLDLPAEPTENTKGIDIGSITTSHLPSSPGSITTEQLTGITPKHVRKLSKRSIMGSISKKFGLGGRDNAAADEDTTTKTLPKSPLPRRASTHQSHMPGDRYPTSSLTPPAGLNLDEVRSFFSASSDERDRTRSFRKTLFKGKNRAVPVEQGRNHSFDGNTAYDAGSLAEARLGADSRARTYDGIGMSKTEFHLKKFGQKLRYLLARGGELVRSLSTRSTRKKEIRPNEDFLSDSLYSGA
ncbi:hypothetical protein M409DRAFT_23457 [Zasmidium cellare ATCC 36951]|uniref:Uncharacterized protein n=1 Tax=Zasmidium cellare ATCC 36951 TaxID=1080233 RepID=A0A6A6CGH3_ZASCE|nr:uncharacterized protein M409DRAFT_23457 [Zasmidium cellare ATCC 36951]KAF2166265.1 hypothetical protein M409DRAFT_23457 [Zasmidium cellare ATCC 36951]